MHMVRWVLSYGFCSKFQTLSSSAKTLKIGKDLTSCIKLKGGNFFETQCSRHSYNPFIELLLVYMASFPAVTNKRPLWLIIYTCEWRQ